MKCDICGKTPQFGHNVSHSKRRTNHKWMPNIHAATVEVEGKPTHMTLCTRCIRTINKLSRNQPVS